MHQLEKPYKMYIHWNDSIFGVELSSDLDIRHRVVTWEWEWETVIKN